MPNVEVRFSGDGDELASTIHYLRSAAGLIGLTNLQVDLVTAEQPYIPGVQLIDFIDEECDSPFTGMGSRVTNALSRNFSLATAPGPYGYIPDLPEGQEAVIGSGVSSKYHRQYLRFATENSHAIDNLGVKGVGFIALFLDRNPAQPVDTQ